VKEGEKKNGFRAKGSCHTRFLILSCPCNEKH